MEAMTRKTARRKHERRERAGRDQRKVARMLGKLHEIKSEGTMGTILSVAARNGWFCTLKMTNLEPVEYTRVFRRGSVTVSVPAEDFNALRDFCQMAGFLAEVTGPVSR